MRASGRRDLKRAALAIVAPEREHAAQAHSRGVKVKGPQIGVRFRTAVPREMKNSATLNEYKFWGSFATNPGKIVFDKFGLFCQGQIVPANGSGSC